MADCQRCKAPAEHHVFGVATYIPLCRKHYIEDWHDVNWNSAALARELCELRQYADRRPAILTIQSHPIDKCPGFTILRAERHRHISKTGLLVERAQRIVILKDNDCTVFWDTCGFKQLTYANKQCLKAVEELREYVKAMRYE